MQKGYEWLWREPAPLMLVELRKLYGTLEGAGVADNPVIRGWAREIGEPGYRHDETPWCGLAQAIAAKRAGWDYRPHDNPLWARNWMDWGDKVSRPMLGDVLVFPRGAGGHVTMYVGEDDACYHCLGGNQSNALNIVRKPKAPLLAARRAHWRAVQPTNVRRIFLNPAGAPLSASEA